VKENGKEVRKRTDLVEEGDGVWMDVRDHWSLLEGQQVVDVPSDDDSHLLCLCKECIDSQVFISRIGTLIGIQGEKLELDLSFSESKDLVMKNDPSIYTVGFLNVL